MPQTEARVWNTGTQENPIFNFELPAGPKGEPGGWNNGTGLGERNLDDITAPGLYHQADGAKGLKSLNYPREKAAGAMLVYNWNGGVFQEFTHIGVGGSFPTYGKYVRSTRGQTWTLWGHIPTQRVDNSVGRAVYTWDDTAGREQLIYGDTGNVNISQFLHSSFQAPEAVDRVNIRRVGQSVTLTLRVKPSESIVGSGRNENRVILTQIPPGFRENPTSYGNSYMGSASPSFAPIAFGATNTNADFRVRGPGGEQWKSGEIIALVATWFTNDPWPSTLTFTS